MTPNQDAAVRVYDSQSEAYHQAFAVFLAHTDQKVNARAWLDRLVQTLPAWCVFIDPGERHDKEPAWFLARFERTIAVEPSPSLSADFQRNCSGAEVLAVRILDANPA